MTTRNSNETVYFDEVFDLMKAENVAEAIEYVKQDKLKVIDTCDKDGTTVLQYVTIILQFNHIIFKILNFYTTFRYKFMKRNSATQSFS